VAAIPRWRSGSDKCTAKGESREKTAMRLLAILLTMSALVVVEDWSAAGPKEGGKTYKPEITPSQPFDTRLAFKGSARATVIVKGDLKSKADLMIEIRDAKGQLVTKDDAGGQFAAVIWYPPQDGIFQIKISVKGDQSCACYVVVR
jgi:hypothetical protein